MQKDDLIYIGHMFDQATKALNIARDKSYEDYEENETLRLALERLVELIGEAASHVSREFRLLHPLIPWSDIVGMRNILIHNYDNIDEESVWHTVECELPTLLAQLRGLLDTDAEKD